MDIYKWYQDEEDHIENSDMSDEEKQEERMLLDDQMREHEQQRQYEHEDIDRRYGH